MTTLTYKSLQTLQWLHQEDARPLEYRIEGLPHGSQQNSRCLMYRPCSALLVYKVANDLANNATQFNQFRRSSPRCNKVTITFHLRIHAKVNYVVEGMNNGLVFVSRYLCSNCYLDELHGGTFIKFLWTQSSHTPEKLSSLYLAMHAIQYFTNHTSSNECLMNHSQEDRL